MMLGSCRDPIAPSSTCVVLQVTYIRIERLYESNQLSPGARHSDAPAGLLKSIEIDFDGEVARPIASR